MALSKAELKEIVAMLKEQAELQAQINGSFDGYISGLKDAKKLNETIVRNRKIEAEIVSKINDAIASGNVAEEAKQKAILKILQEQNSLLEDRHTLLTTNLKDVNKTNILFAKGAATIAETVLTIPKMVTQGYREFKGYGFFDIDKAIKKSALSMGLLSSQSRLFTKNIQNAAMNTTSFGVGAKELAQMQADYSEELGRSVMLDKSGLEAVAKIAAATGLGAEGTSKMAADMEQQGISAERTAEFIEKTMQSSSEMGLNATKVIKNIQQNLKLLNKYNFKDGIKGLEKMAQTVAKLGIEMGAIGPMADKVFDIEGAVDMSAQLQVMGGEWAKLSDPFKLMYLARNDMGGLVEEIGRATEASVFFNKQKGDFEISALEMHRLRKIAEQTGVAYETLAEAGKNARKQTEIKSQINISVDSDTKEFLSNTAKFDENGKAYIQIGAEKKYIDTLTESDRVRLKTQMSEKKSLEKYAKDARTFDDALTNTIDMFKTMLLPIVTQMNEKLIPKIDRFVKKLQESKWIDKMGMMIDKVANVITNTLGWFIEHPKITGAIVGLTAVLPFFFEKANWFANGIALAEGFNLGVSGPSSGVGGMAKNFLSYLGGPSSGVGGMAMTFARVAGPLLGGAIGGYLGLSTGKSMSESLGYKSSTGGNVGGVLGGLAGGAAGWAVGAALAPETLGLSLLIPAIATALGAYGGSALGKTGGDIITGDKLNDGYSPNIVDKINKAGGTNRSILAGGKIHPIDDADSFITKKPHGPIDKAITNNTNTVKHEFGELKISGQVMINSPGNGSISVDLMKNPEFIREMTSMITVEMQKNRNQIQKA